MPPSVTGEISTSEAPVETEIDEAFMPSVRLGFRRSFFVCVRDWMWEVANGRETDSSKEFPEHGRGGGHARHQPGDAAQVAGYGHGSEILQVQPLGVLQARGHRGVDFRALQAG